LVHLGKSRKEWLTTEWVLSQFAASTSAARRRYESFVRAGLHETHREDFHHERAEGAILGEDRFVVAIVSRQAMRNARRISPEAILQAVAKVWSVEEAMLSSSNRARALTEARAAAAYLVAEHGDCTLTALGALLQRDVSSLSLATRALRTALPDDQAPRRKIRAALAECGKIY
jgi:putative transposase